MSGKAGQDDNFRTNLEAITGLRASVKELYEMLAAYEQAYAAISDRVVMLETRMKVLEKK